MHGSGQPRKLEKRKCKTWKSIVTNHSSRRIKVKIRRNLIQEWENLFGHWVVLNLGFNWIEGL